MLLPELEATFLQRSGDEWLGRLRDRGIPCGPINTMDGVANDPQVRSRGMLLELDHALGAVTVPGAPWRLDRAAATTDVLPPPTLGQHTDAILRNELGCDDAEIRRLRASGAVK